MRWSVLLTVTLAVLGLGRGPAFAATESETAPASAAELRQVFERIAERGDSIRAFFAWLHEADPVRFDGADFAAAAADYDIGLDFLPFERLHEVRSNGDRVAFLFDFGAHRGTRVRFGGHRYIALADGRLERRRESERTLWVSHRLLFRLSPEGIASVRRGDLKLKVGPFWPRVQVRTIAGRRGLRRDEQGDPIVRVDGNGEPILREGRPVLERAEAWLVVRVLGRENWAALQALHSGGASG